MLEIIRASQVNIMIFLSGCCGLLVILLRYTSTMSKRRKHALVFMEGSSMLLLISDCLAYAYRGDVSPLGYWVTRISNFLVFFLTLFIIHTFTLYMMDLYRTEADIALPKRLIFCEVAFLLGELYVIISPFADLIYTFDENNQYHRMPGFVVFAVVALGITVLHLSCIIQYRKYLKRRITFSLILFTLVPIISSMLQVALYGVSLTNISIVGVVVLLYIFEVINMNETIERANRLEIQMLRKEQKKIQSLFAQTAQALASSIDAKDEYTHGHSDRVAEYSMIIAKKSGMTMEECNNIYFSALLHDVGKIGVPDEIINKKGRLTDEEYAAIKLHPTIGARILDNISEMPYLSLGAKYHHERYDGKGYPEGLSGEDIPTVARIIAVADSYDAMTSNRSYRAPLTQAEVRDEIMKGVGKQFDPMYAMIMIRLIDSDTDYQMREPEDEKKTGFILIHNNNKPMDKAL
ncbi:MAG: HD-GYP domain-containing protein [Lachnospiraceae bacterium]|nr:HD-GYP domain-containing protein [Lachnospiraceae bacterium]